jgi:hypothetical protein
MATNDLILAMNLTALRANKKPNEQFICEDKADHELVTYTTRAMRLKLASARVKGRQGWWREDECSIDQLKNLLDLALAESDMISVINYAAMIHARRLVDK